MSIASDKSGSKRAPEPFGKYVLLDRIGVGGMAEVFQAIASGPEGFQRSLVVKRMLPQLSQDEAFVRMFIDEAKLSGLLAHPNLVQIFEFGRVDESFFIAMEHVHGRTLASVMGRQRDAGRKMPIGASTEIARQICVGLHYAHSLKSSEGKTLGIVHRDISPPNLMLGFHGAVKILDFGIARVAEGLRESRTQVGMMKGKISYMSPEQLQLADIDHRSDIFAVGIVLHEMLTGHRLFRSTTDYTSSRMVMELPIPLPSLQNPDVPPALDRVVMRALERDRDLRYATAGEMASDLEKVIMEARYSPREHTAVLNELFPEEALLISENALTVSGSIAPSMMQASEKATAYLSYTSLPASASASHRSVGSSMRGAPNRRRGIAAAVGTVLALAAVMMVVRLSRRDQPAPHAPDLAETPAGKAAAPTPPVHLSLDSSPQDSQVTRVDTGQVIGKTPVTITLPRSTDMIAFRFERAGYAAAIHKAIPDLDKIVRVDLAPIVAEPAAESPPRSPLPPRTPNTRKAARSAGSRAATRGPAAQQACWLTVGSSPWAELWVDGKDSGLPTPVVHLPVGCGAHKLRFKRGNPAIDEAVNITVNAGREFKQNFPLANADSDG